MFGRFLVNRVISGVTYIWQQGISVRIEQKSIFKLPYVWSQKISAPKINFDFK